MKKTSALFAVLLGLSCFQAFAEQTVWLETGSGLSMSSQSYAFEGTSFSSSASTIDLMLAAYSYQPNSVLGWFLHTGFGMPISGKIMKTSTEAPVDQSSYIWLLRVESIAGPALRLKMGPSVWFVLGCGLAIKLEFGDHRDLDVIGQTTHGISHHISSGIGGDIGLVIFIIDNVVLKIGSSFAYYFSDYSLASYNDHFQPIPSNNYSEAGLSPYLGIVINWEKIESLGKAESTNN